MLTCPMDIPEQFPVRKTKAQKQIFRTAVQSYGEKLGYKVTVEKRNSGCTQAQQLCSTGEIDQESKQRRQPHHQQHAKGTAQPQAVQGPQPGPKTQRM